MAVELRRTPHERLVDAAAAIAVGVDLHVGLELLGEAARAATDADVAVVRLLDATDGMLVARAILPATSSAAAELAGTRVACADIAESEVPAVTLAAAARAGAVETFVVPAKIGDRVVGSIELLRAAGAFDGGERGVAELAASQLALTVRVLGGDRGVEAPRSRESLLELAGEALAAGGDARRTAHQVARIAAQATGARGAALWRVGERGVELASSRGVVEAALDGPAETALASFGAWRPARVERDETLPAGATHVATLQLGQPPRGVLQLFYSEEAVPSPAELIALDAFASRAAHALRSGELAHDVEVELVRTRALLSIVGEAISRLSLSHTLETAVDRIAELLGIERVGIYLREDGGLISAAGRGLQPGHETVAERLDVLARGPFRARAALEVRAGDSDPVLAPALLALDESHAMAALAVPLRARDEPVGLLVAYPGDGPVGESDAQLLSSLAAQLAVAVQNARLHERATELNSERELALSSERQAARRLGALYEISRSFAQSLSLDLTLEAVTSTVVDVLVVDAAVMRVPGERGDQFVPRAVHVADVRLDAAVRTILDRPQARPSRAASPRLLDATEAARLGDAHALLVPFLEKGSTAAILPIASANELLAELTILSLDPAAPITDETLATAATIAQQASLAIDNARLYQQQKEFTETIQRALLPREEPAIVGLELGAVYESAARVDVGGDVYDYMELEDGRLAVVLGDVTGHGIEATADMAMAKFVFRSLAREHSEPGDFLAHANEVVVGEIAVGKFITMAYLTIDPKGEIVCAAGGHPPPRLVLPDGRVLSLDAGGLALGIDGAQTYDEVRTEFPLGAAVVLYTDGVIESRVGRDLYGVDRLDAILASLRTLPAQAIATAVLDETQAFSGGELTDDVAIVVIKRTA